MEKDTKIKDHHTPKPKKRIRRQILTYLFVFAVLLTGTAIAVLYGSGFRLSLEQGTPSVSRTGILHLTSIPTGANVWIDDHLTTATNNSINLTPTKYKVTIGKDGYNSYYKDVQIQEEVVANIEALLFPKAPTLQSISTLGVEEATVDPSGTKLAFRIASESGIKKNGIYVLKMEPRAIPILTGPGSGSQIVDDTVDNLSQAKITWSPDGKQILASITNGVAGPAEYLLNIESFNDAPRDITATVTTLKEDWENLEQELFEARINSLKPKVREYAKKNFKIISWSPDEKKILYQASANAEMPVFATPRRIGNNWLYERRDLTENAIYVYNTTEDFNTRIIDTTNPICLPNRSGIAPSVSETPVPEEEDPAQASEKICQEKDSIENPFTWFPDSDHLIYVNDRKIEIVEDDGANLTTIFAGPFIKNFVAPWTDGSKLVILTNLGNLNVLPTLYTIGLK